MTNQNVIDYHYSSNEPDHTHSYLWGPVEEVLRRKAENQKVFELGCGNGSFAKLLANKGYQVTAVDPSADGIYHAQRDFHSKSGEVRFAVGSAYDPLHEEYGAFGAVVSLEVVEHVYYPRKFADCVYNLLVPGGVAVVSTPYHGYLKNVALALSGRLDSHFTALWDHGHIKFWSRKTLRTLFKQSGFNCEGVMRLGRMPWFAKSMVGVFRKPSDAV